GWAVWRAGCATSGSRWPRGGSARGRAGGGGGCTGWGNCRGGGTHPGGAGWVLYGLRTLPVAVHIAERVRAVAPDAWVINFTNPAGMVTEAMQRVLGPRVIGICDSPVGLVRRAARAAGADPDAPGFGYDYVGLNHLGWLRRLTVDG